MKEDYKTIISIVIPYAYFCSFINLYYYWKAFGIQPFEYISLAETISYAVPFIMLSAFMLIPVFIVEAFRKNSNPLKLEMSTKSLLGYILALNLIFIILAELKIILSIPLYMGIASGIMSLAVLLSDSDKFKKIFSSRPIRLFIALIISALPAAAMMQASFTSAPILEKNGYKYLLSSDLKESKSNNKLIYIGHLGNFIFVRNQCSNNTIIYPLSSFRRLEIHKENKKI